MCGAAMSINPLNQSIKVIGTNGQISLGKEFAGRKVLVEQQEPGVWLIRTAVVIPENELWLHKSKAKRDLTDALSWAETNVPRVSEPKTILGKLEHGKRSARKPSKA